MSVVTLRRRHMLACVRETLSRICLYSGASSSREIMVQKGHELIEWHRPGDEIPLDKIATIVSKKSQALRVFYAFCDDLEAQIVRQFYSRSYQ